MEDENVNYTINDEIYLPSRATRRKIVTVSLLFCWGLIGYLAYAGDPNNSLHQSLASWAFFSWISIVFAYAISAGYENQKVLALQETLFKTRSQQ